MIAAQCGSPAGGVCSFRGVLGEKTGLGLDPEHFPRGFDCDLSATIVAFAAGPVSLLR